MSPPLDCRHLEVKDHGHSFLYPLCLRHINCLINVSRTEWKTIILENCLWVWPAHIFSVSQNVCLLECCFTSSKLQSPDWLILVTRTQHCHQGKGWPSCKLSLNCGENKTKKEETSNFIEGHSRMLKWGFSRKWWELLFHRAAFLLKPLVPRSTAATSHTPPVTQAVCQGPSYCELPPDVQKVKRGSHTAVTFDSVQRLGLLRSF